MKAVAMWASAMPSFASKLVQRAHRFSLCHPPMEFSQVARGHLLGLWCPDLPGRKAQLPRAVSARQEARQRNFHMARWQCRPEGEDMRRPRFGWGEHFDVFFLGGEVWVGWVW